MAGGGQNRRPQPPRQPNSNSPRPPTGTPANSHPAVPPFGGALPFLPRPREPPASDPRRKSPQRTDRPQRPLDSPWTGYKLHGDNLIKPWDRTSDEIVLSNDESEAGLPKMFHAIINWDEQCFGNLYNSPAKFVADHCVTMPSAAVRIKDQTDANFMVDFELNAFDVLVTALDMRVTTGIQANVRQHFRGVLKSLDQLGYLQAANHQEFTVIRLVRKGERPPRGYTDFSCYDDTVYKDEPTPQELARCHAEHQPYRRPLKQLGASSQKAMDGLKTAKTINIFVARSNPWYTWFFARYQKIMMNAAPQSKDGKWRSEWYWSLHPEYVLDDPDLKHQTRRFDMFFKQKTMKKGPRPWLERQPWLQKDAGDLGQYVPVWSSKFLRNRFAGVSQYRHTFIPALLFDMEHFGRIDSEQFNERQTYLAEFAPHIGHFALIKIKLSGFGVETIHGKLQARPPQGTEVHVYVDGDSLDEQHNFSGIVEEQHRPNSDFITVASMPAAYGEKMKNPLPRGWTKVKVIAEHRDYQMDLHLEAVDKACFDTEAYLNSPPSESERLPFHVAHMICGDLVTKLSPDFFGDWENKARGTAGFERTHRIVTQVLPSHMNTEQHQAYWFGLRGFLGGLMNIQGFPGTGKSFTFRCIAVAMLFMDYRVIVSAQSNNGVDAVFEKIASWIEQNEPGWLAKDYILRLGATTVDRQLLKVVKKLLQDGEPVDFANITSSISSPNIPHSAAYKIAMWIKKHPDDEITRDFEAWRRAAELHKAQMVKGQMRKPPGVDKARGVATLRMFQEACGEPRLIGATAAALQRDDIQALGIQFDMLLFDEASQAMESSFLLAVTSDMAKDIKAAMLGGDQKQLPPVVLSLTTSPLGNMLAESPMARTTNAYHDRTWVQLVRNYRSHPDIIDASSKIIYSGKMISGYPAGKFPDSDLSKKFQASLRNGHFAWGLFRKPAFGDGRFWFVNVRGFSAIEPGGTSSWNPNGVEASSRLARIFASNGYPQHKIKIISMYKYELQELRSRTANYPDIEMCTVDSFQGKEDDIVIVHFSAAFNSRHNPLGHTNNPQRLNVAITRARFHMFCVGYVDYWLQRIQTYSGNRPSQAKKDKRNKACCLLPSSDPLPQLAKYVRDKKIVVQWPEERYVDLPNPKEGY